MPTVYTGFKSLSSEGQIYTLRCTLRVTDFVPKAYRLCTRMVTQDGNEESILRQTKITFHRYPETFS